MSWDPKDKQALGPLQSFRDAGRPHAFWNDPAVAPESPAMRGRGRGAGSPGSAPHQPRG